jgi:hypothetical protein
MDRTEDTDKEGRQCIKEILKPVSINNKQTIEFLELFFK